MSLKNPWRKNKIGGSQDILGRILALSSLGYEIDVIAIDDAEQLQAPPNLPDNINVFLYKKSMNIINSIKFPIASASRYIEEICEFLKNREYDYAFAESEFMIPYWKNKKVRAKKSFIRMHNIESEYYLELAKSDKKKYKRVLYKIDSKRLKKIENELINFYDQLLFISESERETFSKRRIDKKLNILPASVPLSIEGKSFPITPNNFQLLSFGDFTLDINKKGLIWFLDNVWPIIIRENKNAKLKIAGNGAAFFKDYEKDNIEILGYVEDLQALFNEMQYIIVPLLEGAGVKIKLVESLLMKKTIITTSKGIEGTDLKDNVHLFVADSASKFAEKCLLAINNYDESIKIAENGFEFAKELFSIEGQKKYLKEILHQN